MIINKDINPENNIYYLGSQVIQLMKNFPQQSIDYLEIYHKLNNDRGISFNIFLLTLDWLFLIGVIDIKKGELIKCF